MANLKDRCAGLTVVVELSEVASYRFFAEGRSAVAIRMCFMTLVA
jgi:hypothetical protein